jgi:hypothetical protein
MYKDRVSSPPYHLKEKDTIMEHFRRDYQEVSSRASSSKSKQFDFTRYAFTSSQSQRADDTTTIRYPTAAGGENYANVPSSQAQITESYQRAYDTTTAGYPMMAAGGENYANVPSSQAQITESYQRAYDTTTAGYPMMAAGGENLGSALPPYPAQITEPYTIPLTEYDQAAARSQMTATSREYVGSALSSPVQITEPYPTLQEVYKLATDGYLTAEDVAHIESFLLSTAMGEPSQTAAYGPTTARYLTAAGGANYASALLSPEYMATPPIAYNPAAAYQSSTAHMAEQYQQYQTPPIEYNPAAGYQPSTAHTAGLYQTPSTAYYPTAVGYPIATGGKYVGSAQPSAVDRDSTNQTAEGSSNLLQTASGILSPYEDIRLRTNGRTLGDLVRERLRNETGVDTSNMTTKDLRALTKSITNLSYNQLQSDIYNEITGKSLSTERHRYHANKQGITESALTSLYRAYMANKRGITESALSKSYGEASALAKSYREATARNKSIISSGLDNTYYRGKQERESKNPNRLGEESEEE